MKARDALILPDPATRFAHTAARLDSLSAGHPMGQWLRFMARLTKAQHAMESAMGPIAGPDQAAVGGAVTARLPPLTADGHRRDPMWRDGLALLLDVANDSETPAPARAAMASLRDRGVDGAEALGDGFLRGCVDMADASAALYVAAALQVYFTRLAASLQAPSLRLLPQRGLCPCCGSTPVSAWSLNQARPEGCATSIARSASPPGITCALFALPAASRFP